MRTQPGLCQIKVRRDLIFEDSYAEILQQTPTDFKKRLMIEFEGEGRIGLRKSCEKILLSHETFNVQPRSPTFRIFRHNRTLQINLASGVNPEHLNYFKFIGGVLGLSIFHRHFVDASFVVSFHKMFLKKTVTLADLESVDAELHHRLTRILENDIASVPISLFMEETNKEYVDLVVEYPISKRVKDQFNAFMSGFNELNPQDLITVFDEREIGWLIGGMTEIDGDDWTKFTKYRG